LQRLIYSIPRLIRTPGGVRLLICLLLAGAALIPYIQVRDHTFITFDDDLYITANSLVRAGLTWEGVKWACTTMHACNWHPLTWWSHMLDCQLYGLWAGGHHLTNVAFHLANTILLFLFWARVTGALWPSALLAALFALHPLHVESVAWVSERKDVLCAFFWLATMLAYARYAAAPSPRRYLLVLLFFTLGVLAKPMAVTLPFVLLLLDWWPLGRVWGGPPAAPGFAGGGERRPAPVKRVYRQLIREKIPLIALAALASLITLVAQKGSGAVIPLALQPLGPRIANALVAYVKYLVKLLWPFPMSFFYALAPVPWWQAAGAGLALLALSAWLLSQARRRPYLAVGWLWYLGTLVPVIGLVQVGGQALADRYTYIPFIGLFLMVAWGTAEVTAGWRRRQALLSAAAGVILLASLLATWVQVGYWRSPESLFRHALHIDKNNYMAYHHLGMALANQGKINQAVAAYHQTLVLAPLYSFTYNNLAIIYAEQGRFDEAVSLFKTAIRLAPSNTGFYYNLAFTYQLQGKTAEAEAVMAQVLRLSGQKGP
jgi:tetratricopeptide (TPR) repeat protein